MLNHPNITSRQKIALKTSNSLTKNSSTVPKLDLTKVDEHNPPKKPARFNRSPRDQESTPIKIDEPIPPINMFILNGFASPKGNHSKMFPNKTERRDSIGSERSYSRTNHLDKIGDIEDLEHKQVDRNKTITYLEKKTRGAIYCPELWSKSFYEGILKTSGIFDIFQDRKRLAWVSIESKGELQEVHLENKFPEFKVPAKRQYSTQNLKKINNYPAMNFSSSRQQSMETLSHNETPSNRNSDFSSHAQNIPIKSSRFANRLNITPDIMTYYNEDVRRLSQPLSKTRADDLKINTNQTPVSGTKDTLTNTTQGFYSARGNYKPNITAGSFNRRFGFKPKDPARVTSTTMNFSNNDIRPLSPDALEMLGKFESFQQSIQNFQAENSEFKKDLNNLSDEGMRDFQPDLVKRNAKKLANRHDKVLTKLKKVVRIENPGKPKISKGLTPFQQEMKRKVAEIENKYNSGSPLKKKFPFGIGIYRSKID